MPKTLDSSTETAVLRDRLRDLADGAPAQSLANIVRAAEAAQEAYIASLPPPSGIPAMSDPGLEDEIAEAEARYARGEYVTWEELQRRMGI